MGAPAIWWARALGNQDTGAPRSTTPGKAPCGRHHRHCPTFGFTHAWVEAMNQNLRLMIKMTYGFEDTDNLFSMAVLKCSGLWMGSPGVRPRRQYIVQKAINWLFFCALVCESCWQKRGAIWPVKKRFALPMERCSDQKIGGRSCS